MARQHVPPHQPTWVGISGARDVGPWATTLVECLKVLVRSHESGIIDGVVTGACVGVDETSALYLTDAGVPVHLVVPADASRVMRRYQYGCATWERMPEDSSYRDRNARIVEVCGALWAFPTHPEHDLRSRRSGTWQTIRLARGSGRPVFVVVLARANTVPY